MSKGWNQCFLGVIMTLVLVTSAFAVGFDVSQSFEAEGDGWGFTNNIVDDGLYRFVEFDGTLFRGAGTQRDYVGIWPLHTDTNITSPVLFTDEDGTLATVLGIDGTNCISVEDSRAFPVDEDGNVVDYLAMNFDPLSIVQVEEVQVTLSVAAPRGAGYSNGTNDVSELSVRLIVDGGEPDVLGQFRGTAAGYNKELALDEDFDGLGEGTVLTAQMQDFTFTAPVSGYSMVVQIRVESRQNNQEICFDNVRIKSTSHAEGFSVSQSFETDEPGLAFSNNILDDGLYLFAPFSNALFRGYGGPRDFAVIWPLHADTSLTSPALLTDDGPLAALTNIDGINCVAVEDSRGFCTDEQGDPCDYMTINFEPLDISNVSSVQVALSVAAPRPNAYSNGTNDVTQLSVNLIVDGNPPVTIGHFCGVSAGYSKNLALDKDFDGLGEGIELTTEMQDFVFNTAVAGSELVVQISAESRQNNQELCFDNVRISSTVVPAELSSFSLD